MQRVGFIGFRGMVGSVLTARMTACADWASLTPVFLSTTQVGATAPDIGHVVAPVADAHDLGALGRLDVIVSCQGGAYTERIHPALRSAGWKGIWIDAASTLRMNRDAAIFLDPVNLELIERARARGVRDFVGGNCTVSLMLMVLAGPIKQGWIEWISSMTYQAASGAGAKHMQELVQQMGTIATRAGSLAGDASASILELDRRVAGALSSPDFPTSQFSVPLAGSLIPWIDAAVEGGQTREEWKAGAEANKILGLDPPLPIDGLCVRVGAMRCHSQALTIKLKRAVPIDEIEGCIRESNPWAKLIANTPEATKSGLTPAAISGSLDVAIGRLRTMKMGDAYLAAFTVGDQLLWGAAEPIRRMLKLVINS